MKLKIEDMIIFTKVAEKCSFNKAADELNIPTSTLSRRISALEKTLEILLFERSTRQVLLTPQGKEIIAYCEEIINKKKELEYFIESNYHQNSGVLSVTTSHATVSLLSAEFIPQFILKYPNITLSLKSSTDTDADLHSDIVITSAYPKNENLVATKICSLSRSFFASPSYLTKHGKPQSLQDLKEHNILYVKNSSNPCIYSYIELKKTALQSKNLIFFDIFQAIESAISGHGIVWAPDFIIKNKIAPKALQMLFDEKHSIEVPSYAIYPYRINQPKKIISFISELKKFINNKLHNKIR